LHGRLTCFSFVVVLEKLILGRKRKINIENLIFGKEERKEMDAKGNV
jgi:hypothetical protein